MTATNTKKNLIYRVLIEGIRAAGMGFGIYLTKPTLEKRIAKSLSLADSSVNTTLSHSPKRDLASPVNFELAGLGGIAAYKIYKGLRRKKTANLVEGIFLTAVLAAAVVYTAKLTRNQSVESE
ncbi:hypothetical protein DU508_03010 [Pedobacter chinensis]|uniref:Uncharacterized protein n=1 Tax=Pedobacter chinensis TaxID=2282421 RepID=A0A369Q3U5_9SPHI|nr:hypothetical protein [Pedobacter chinensis]RDC57937.1 hypothetical protein DU508_03010 [Pedobacter chinensis]